MTFEIVMVVMAFLVVAIWIAGVHNWRNMEIRERIARIEKGLEVPPIEAAGAPNYLLRGLQWTLASIALTIVMLTAHAELREKHLVHDERVVDGKLVSIPLRFEERPAIPRAATQLGLIPGAIGIAYLIYYWTQRKRQPPTT